MLIILHEKRKAKKQTKTKQKRAETSIQPLLDKYLDEPQFCSLLRDALLACHAIVPNERAIVRKKSVTKPSERLRKRVQCFSVVDPLFHDSPLFDLFLQMFSLALIVNESLPNKCSQPR